MSSDPRAGKAPRSSAWALPLLLAAAACSDDGAVHRAKLVEPIYSGACRFVDCSGHGTCEETADGEPLCVCSESHAGARCQECAVGFHRDAEQRCLPDQGCADHAIDPCAPHGSCTDEDGAIACECSPGYEGARCELCVPGYRRDEFDECLQLVIGPDGVQTAPNECDAQTCSNHGLCSEVDGARECACHPGYAGARCNSCATGYGERDGRCVPNAGCTASDCGECQTFDGGSDFPSNPDNCVSRDSLMLADMTLTSRGSQGTVWLCGASTFYQMTAEHVMLEAGNTEPAEMRFDSTVLALDLDYAARSDLSLEVLADGDVIEVIEAESGDGGKLALTFDPPVVVVGFRNRDATLAEIAIDNVLYERTNCN